MRRHWRKIRYQFEWLGLLVLTTVLPRLSRRTVVRLARMLGRIVFYFDRYGRAVTLANIAAAFGDEYTPLQRQEIARASYCNFSRTMLDLLWSPALTPQNFHRYIRVENVEILQRLQARGESVVVVCLHQGNFEWASLATGFHGVSATIVTKRFKNPRVDGFFRRCREVSGHRIIPQKSSMLRLLKHVRHGGVAGMLADLNRHPTEAATVIDAFGMKMCVTFLHAVLVQRGPAKLLPVEGISQPDGSCRVTFHEPLKLCRMLRCSKSVRPVGISLNQPSGRSPRSGCGTIGTGDTSQTMLHGIIHSTRRRATSSTNWFGVHHPIKLRSPKVTFISLKIS
ncbi:MAG: hypothetical protein QM813_15155 [Verrucomicrobiota bacterium]